MNQDHVINRLTPIFGRVDSEIKAQLSSDVPLVSEICQYILLAGGKRVRPTLFVLAAHLCGLETGFEYQIAPAFEYLHAATLLHDDVVDAADTRRGRKAAHLVYGNPGVILVGDYLLAKSMGLGAETGRLAFTEVMAGVVAQMAEGEVLQMLHARDPEITEEDYEKVIYRKTGVLIESACYLGAIIADAPGEQAEALKEFGRNIGLAFQIIDDTLDYTGNTSEFGKPVGHDLDEGKVTLPLIRTLARAVPEDRKALAGLIVKTTRTDEEFSQVRRLLDRYQGLSQAMDQASQTVGQAQAALSVFPESSVKRNLVELADYIVSRRK